MIDDVSWDPRTPREWLQGSRMAVVLSATSKLDGSQLLELRRIFDLPAPNLLALRKHLCDGQDHVLAARLSLSEVKSVSELLSNLGLAYRIVAEDQVEWTQHGKGLRLQL